MCDIPTKGNIVKISEIEEEKLSVDWIITHFTLRRRHVDFEYDDYDRWYTSPKFSFGNEDWQLSVWPNWTDVRLNPVLSRMGLYLERCTEGPPKTFHVTVGIKERGEMVMEREVQKEFSSRNGGWLLEDFCSFFYLFSYYRNKSDLIITCVIKTPNTARCDENKDADVLYKPQSAILDPLTLEPVPPIDESQSSDKQGGEKVLEDLNKLLASGESSDCTIQVGDDVFKVHKLILSARCSVLSKMFLHETTEKAMNKVTLEDCEPDIFKEFLQYLYTGSVLSLTEKNVFGLYRIADKYLTDDLKHQCLEHIQDTLSVPTFCNAVKLALMHGERGLLQQAIDFAVKNIQKIVITAEWQNFLREYPTEANEIFIKCVCPQ